jgi:DNA-directed RNA polymerase specialized sigma24 family protein
MVQDSHTTEPCACLNDNLFRILRGRVMSRLKSTASPEDAEDAYAEDAYQEAVLALLSQSSSSRASPVREAEAFLLTVARRRLVDTVRKQWRSYSLSHLEADVYYYETHDGLFTTMILDEAMGVLPSVDRALIQGRADGEEYADLASRLRLSVYAAEKRFQRARKRVRFLLLRKGFESTPQRESRLSTPLLLTVKKSAIRRSCPLSAKGTRLTVTLTE